MDIVHDLKARRRARDPRTLSGLLFLANASLIGVFQGSGAILLPSAVAAIDPANKVRSLALLTTLSALATVVALVVGGIVSDRTRSRWGRRTPSLAVSALASVVLLPLVPAAATIWQLGIVMTLLGFTLNYYQAVLIAMLPDRIPAASQGFASAAISLGVPLGIAMGVNVAAAAATPLIGYVALAVVLAVATLTLILVAPEPSSLDLPVQRRSAAAPGTGILSSFRDRDFALAFTSRFILFVAYFTVTGYLFYVVQDYVGTAALPGRDPATAVSRILTFATLGWVLITPLTGFIADRLHRTTLFVALSSVGIGLAMIVPGMSSAWSAMLWFGGLIGLCFGIYMAIDLKLMAMVLPSEETAGRDMGILSVASSGPIVLAPAIAAGIIALGSYRALFAVGAALAIAGGVVALFIRKRG